MNWHQLVNDAASSTSHWVGLGRFFRDIHTLNNDVISIYALFYNTALAFVFTSYDDNFVTFTNLIHDDSLQNFRRKRHDFHEALSTQLARYWPENASTDRLK